MSVVYELTVYHDDDVAELFDVSTDIGHARPYLKAPTGYPEQEVNFAKGTASIGQVNVQIVDVPTVATDQKTGYVTGQLPDANGFSALNGHRALLTEDIDGAGPTPVTDGVIRSVRLLDNFSGYELELRDIRERERNTKAFANTTTPTILPHGVLAGYGVTFNILGGTFVYPVGPTVPLRSIYRQSAANSGIIIFQRSPVQFPQLLLTEPMREALDSVSTLEGEGEVLIYDRLKVLWRAHGSGGAYTELEQIALSHPNLAGVSNRLLHSFASDDGLSAIRVNNVVSGDTLPAANQAIEIIIQYAGPPTADWRFHLQDLTVGELLRNLYRGDYSEENPRIRYDEAALLLLTTPVRMRLKEPVEDVRAWAEEHAYPIAHAAPTLNVAGEISPITYLLPDASVSLVELGDSNCRPSGGGWSQASEDAVNVVRVTYERIYGVSASRNLAAQTGGASDQVQTREVTIEHRVQDSIDLLGEQVLEIKSDLLTAIGLRDGGPWLGDIAHEVGGQVSDLITRMATDRFALGGQYFALKADRSDSGVEGLKVGSWVTVGVSWMPDYASGKRGLSRLAQVIGRRNLNGAWASLTLIDAGTAAAPLTQPTLGTVTAAATGVVSIPVTALGGGFQARIDYAVNDTEPAITSELWSFLGRVGSVPKTLKTPPVTPGTSVWVRARSEGVSRRPSTYTTAVSVATTNVPRVLELGITTDVGVPTVDWTPNEFCLGVRVHYELHDVDKLPTYPDSVDVDASDLEVVISGVILSEGLVFSVQVEPFPGWTGSAVSGSPGPVVETREVGILVLDPELHGVRVLFDIPDDNNVRIKWERGVRVNSVWIYVKTLPQPVADADGPWPDDSTLPTHVFLSGNDQLDVAVPSAENLTFVQLEPRDARGLPGNPVRIEVQPKSIIAPEIAVTEVRTSTQSVVTVDVEDRDLRVTAIEYKKRDGAEGGDTLDASWQTAWTSSSGTIGSSQTLQRVINVPVAAGLEGELQWRVRYTDIYGNVQNVGDSFKVVNLEATTGSVMVPWTDVLPEDDNTSTWKISLTNAYLFPNSTSARIYFGTVLLPPGLTATTITLIGYRAGGSDVVTLSFRKIASTSGGTSTTIALLTHDTTGWQAKAASISELVDGDNIYFFFLTLDANSASNDVRFRGFKVDYSRPAYQYSY